VCYSNQKNPATVSVLGVAESYLILYTKIHGDVTEKAKIKPVFDPDIDVCSLQVKRLVMISHPDER
jgi:hypothetical protein